ncbi:MAG: hypothetical protein F6K42_19825 [Leptolyngbya sp. SIO1D8]|nr:hypothetical protein [Leptolyngbya sp. SIO1D8]
MPAGLYGTLQEGKIFSENLLKSALPQPSVEVKMQTPSIISKINFSRFKIAILIAVCCTFPVFQQNDLLNELAEYTPVGGSGSPSSGPPVTAINKLKINAV